MLRVYACLTEQHDLRLVFLAGLICVAACLISADPRAEMVVAEGMGDEHCQASGAEKSHRRTGTAARRDYASHVE